MKKRIVATLLALCMVLGLGVGAFAAGDGTSDVDPSEMEWDEFLEWVAKNDAAHGHGDAGPSEEELNDYALTEEDMQALADAIGGFEREDIDNAFEYIRLTMERLLTTYPDAIADILDGGSGGPGAAESIRTDTNGYLGTESQLEVVAAVSDWLEQQQISGDRTDDLFLSLFGNIATDIEGKYEPFMEEILSGGEKRPAKTAEDEVTEQDLQELLTYIGKAVEDEYLTPNGIDPAALVWPTDPNTFRYFDEMVTNYCISTLTGEPPAPVREEYVPASPDKEIMDAVYAGIMNWLDGFESVDYEYLIALSQEIDHIEYILEYLPANVTFE